MKHPRELEKEQTTFRIALLSLLMLLFSTIFNILFGHSEKWVFIGLNYNLLFIGLLCFLKITKESQNYYEINEQNT